MNASGGVMNVALDFGSSAFNGDSRWLELGVRTNGSSGAFTTLSPRQFIVSTPYAIQARTASSASSVSAANISGVLSDARLSTNVAPLSGSANFAGTLTAAAFTGNGSGLVDVPGALRWQTVASTSHVGSMNTGYILTNTLDSTITLPATANIGDIIRVSAVGGAWRVNLNAGQSIVATPTATLTSSRWTARAEKRNWHSIACSADGTKVVATVEEGQLFTSSDSGVRWTSRDEVRNWAFVAASADGSTLVATVNAGPIFISYDSGVTWTPRDEPRSVRVFG